MRLDEEIFRVLTQVESYLCNENTHYQCLAFRLLKKEKF